VTRRQSSRREFLQGKAAAQAMAALGEQIAPAEPASAPPDPSQAGTYLVHLARRAMACQFEFFLNAGQYARGSQVALAGHDLVAQLEEQLSVYRPDSEISRLNAEASRQPLGVEQRLFALLELAVEIHAATGGAFDITAGALSEVWGFTRRAGTLPGAEAIAAALPSVGTQWLKLDRQQQTAAFDRPGVKINLGAIGKGYALDRVAELLSAEGVNDFLLHGGHSSVLARGTHGALPLGAGWLVGVRHPLRPERRLGQLSLVDEAVATSGSGTQFFEHAGRRYGHIIDPRSGWPAEGVLSSTVRAPTAAVADALSTAFYVLGPAAAESFCAEHPEIACLLVSAGEKVGSLCIHEYGLRSGQWSVCEQ
jgi:thiamine biosynthesis lipoprotein